MMAELPWVRWFSSDWLAGTRGLSIAETAVYITTLCLIYEKDGPLKVEPAWLARYCSTSQNVVTKALDGLVAKGKLKRLDDGALMNGRAQDEIARRKKFSERQRTNAQNKTGKNTNKTNGAAEPRQSRGTATDMPTRTRVRIKKEKKEVPSFKKKAVAYRLDEKWKVPNEWIAEAVAMGLTQAGAMAEAEAMRNWSMSAPKGEKVDWHPFWRSWVQHRLDNPNGTRGSPAGDDDRTKQARSSFKKMASGDGK